MKWTSGMAMFVGVAMMASTPPAEAQSGRWLDDCLREFHDDPPNSAFRYTHVIENECHRDGRRYQFQYVVTNSRGSRTLTGHLGERWTYAVLPGETVDIVGLQQR